MLDLPTREEWNNLPGKSARKEALISLRKDFSDKDIRDYWGFKPQSYYNLLHRYNLIGKNAEAPPEGGEDELEQQRQRQRLADVLPTNERPKKGCSVEGCDRPHAAKGYCQNHYAKFKQKNKVPTGGTNANEPVERQAIPSERDWPRKGVVEAEFTVISDIDIPEPEPKIKEPFRSKWLESSPKAESPNVDLPFPTIKGTSAQLRKQFEGVSLFLEGLESESARFEIRLSVVKAND